MRFAPKTVRLLPGAALAIVLVAPDLRAENHGRALVPGEALTTYISPAGDVDDLTFDAAAGWKVQVKGKALKDPVLDPDGTWSLAPTLQLVAPDGSVETQGVVVKDARTSSSLSATLIEGGRFAIRLKGASGIGGCVLTWKLTPARIAPPLKNQEVPANQEFPVIVPARGGALVSWSLKFKGDGDAQVYGVQDPRGEDAGYDPETSPFVRRTLTSESVKDFPLPEAGGGGDWKLLVRNALGASTLSLKVQVKLPKAAKSSARLTLAEPVLTSISQTSSTCGVPVTLTGENLGTDPRGIYFGTKAATGVAVADGTTASCSVPGGTGTVDVTFVAEDGQEAFLPAAFTFKPFPTLTGFSPATGPGVGHVDMHLFGTGFETESQGLYSVIIGDTLASRVTVLSPTEITLQIPAHVSGSATVVLRDQCGQTATAPVSFTYSSLLTVGSVVPSAIPVFGGIPLVVYGAGFAATDTVSLDGAPVVSTPYAYSGSVIGHRIAGAQVPAHAPGRVDVQVRSAGGQTTTLTGGLAYYAFADITDYALPAASATDDWGGVSTALGDDNGDGTVDWIAIANDAPLSASRIGTRLLVNDGTGAFTDRTGTKMPSIDPKTDFSANAVVSGRFGSDSYTDLYLSRPGTGTEARRTTDLKFVSAFGRLLLNDSAGNMSLQEWEGALSRFSIPGTLTYTKCFVYDFDFRSVAAAVGDLDGDLDQDIALVNDTSINWFTGVNCNYRWMTCAGGYYASCYSTTTNAVGSALRICSVGSTGGVLDRTATFVTSQFTSTDDFRGTAVAVGDMNADFFNDILISMNTGLGSPGSPIAATRLFKQKNLGVSVTFTKTQGILPAVSSSTDDWRGDALALPDLNTDLYRDLVVALDRLPPGGGAYGTRILLQNTSSLAFEDKTAALLAGVLPAGDAAFAKAVLAVDIDKDGDQDLILCTPGSTGAGNRRTRLLLNAYRDEITGMPRLIDASSLLPPAASDAGNAVAVAAGDVTGDKVPDIILTDTHQTSGTPVRRTRIFRQVR